MRGGRSLGPNDHKFGPVGGNQQTLGTLQIYDRREMCIWEGVSTLLSRNTATKSAGSHKAAADLQTGNLLAVHSCLIIVCHQVGSGQGFRVLNKQCSQRRARGEGCVRSFERTNSKMSEFVLFVCKLSTKRCFREKGNAITRIRVDLSSFEMIETRFTTFLQI